MRSEPGRTFVHGHPLRQTGVAAVKCVTDAQIRAARGLLAWTISDLAERSGVQQGTITALETGQTLGDPKVCDVIARTFEGAGVILLDNCCTAEGGPGVRLRRHG
ncbi:helix-turn-helix transcriptional regulator, partial [Methylobacterium soli]|uniref:helix-turn-helix transcriptional regulator n=1 Tax=Methylobacterium soli TaxID=553447 RepID=UPI002795C368